MIEKLKEMLEMQRVLDANIYETHGVEYNEEKTYMALFDELGELNHELKPTWCWWKKTVKPLDREKVLEELVDVWHFALSIYYHNYDEVYEDELNIDYQKEFDGVSFGWLYNKIINAGFRDRILLLQLALTYKLGFTFDDVYEAYKKKNEENWNRLKRGY